MDSDPCGSRRAPRGKQAPRPGRPRCPLVGTHTMLGQRFGRSTGEKSEPAYRIAVLFFDGVEELDAVGLWEVFVSWSELESGRPVTVSAVSPDGADACCSKGLHVQIDSALPDIDAVLVLVPGGPGARFLAEDAAVLELLRNKRKDALTVSVCTGALVLAAAGLLGGRRATTHHLALDALAAHDSSRWCVIGGWTTGTSPPPLECRPVST